MHELVLFGIGLVLMSVTVTMHAYGTSLWKDRILSHYSTLDGEVKRSEVYTVLLLTAVILLALHLVEVLIWAIVYQLLTPISVIGSLEQAYYFSLVTFTTLGYGDITLGPDWRILSGMEALNGVLLIGWTTAFLYAVLQRTWEFSQKGGGV
jgi:hypothetical protein